MTAERWKTGRVEKGKKGDNRADIRMRTKIGEGEVLRHRDIFMLMQSCTSMRIGETKGLREGNPKNL